jgi:hypothetical protein
VGKKKRPLSDEELEDRGWRQEERRYAWTHGRGTQFQTCIAKVAYPPANPEFIKHLVVLAWTPHYAPVLQQILDEARRDPGPDGADRAIEAARDVWNDIARGLRNEGGRPKSDDMKRFLAYGEALAAAKQADPNVTVRAVQEAFVLKHELAKVRDLTEVIRRTRRRHGEWVDLFVPKGQKTSL